MRVILYLSNLKYTGKKDINPLRCNRLLNWIFVHLCQSHALMKQFIRMYSPYRSCPENLHGGWFYQPQGQIQYFAAGVRTVAFAFFILFHCVTAFSQPDEIDPMPIKLKAQVLSLGDEMPVPNAFIVNLRTHSAITTDELGRFTMEMLNVDSLSVSSLGFSKTTAHIPANYNEMNVLIIYAKPIRFSLPDVNVNGQQKKVNMDGVPVAKKNDIAPELRGDAYDSKPPVIAALLTPASFLQYYLSKSEREKRETRQAIVSEKDWEVISKYYNKELVMQLTGMNNAQADFFMIYINSKGLLYQMSDEYNARNMIKEQYKIYKEEGH